MLTLVRPAQLATWFESVRAHGDPLVLDVREPHELRVSSVKPVGFDLLAIPMGVIAKRLHELDPKRPIACLCHHGSRSMQVASFLKTRGFGHVANISGGIYAWAAELDPAVPRY